MITLQVSPNDPLKLLCIGAHSDDIEIGCGGTIRRLLQTGREVSVYWFVASGTPARHEEANAAAGRFLEGARSTEVHLAKFTDGHFPFEAREIKSTFAGPLRGFEPDIVFTHYREDRHQDHRVLSDLTWQTFRNQLILEYEIPKFDGDLGQPNVFSELTDTDVGFKVSTIMDCFGTQRSKHWFAPETFRALMRLRGMECASPSGWAEAFHGRKVVASL